MEGKDLLLLIAYFAIVISPLALLYGLLVTAPGKVAAALRIILLGVMPNPLVIFWHPSGNTGMIDWPGIHRALSVYVVMFDTIAIVYCFAFLLSKLFKFEIPRLYWEDPKKS